MHRAAIQKGDAAMLESLRLDFAMRLDLSMSDKGRQMVSAMYYFAPGSCAILVDSESQFRLYFALGICRERRRRKPSPNRHC